MRLNYHIQHFDNIDSTNKEVLRQAEKGAPEGLVIVAKKQTHGKGRLGREWHTIEHALAMSVLLRPNIQPEDVPKLSLVTAVAVHEALSLFVPPIANKQVGIKWPNDLLIDGKKVAGILTEMRCEASQVKVVVIGIGINITQPALGWAANITAPATSLDHASKQSIQKEHVLQAVLESLNIWYIHFLKHGFPPIQKAWQASHISTGKMVQVYDGNVYIIGEALGLDQDGALRLLVNGIEQRIIAGDVSIMDNKS